MTKGYIIIIVSLWLSFPKVTCAGNALMRSLDALNRPVLQNVESTQDAETFFAQNDQKKTSDDFGGKGVEKADEDTTQPKTLTQEKNAPKKAKELKPFVPSETIPADQGVDFPYDI
jgi:hypothetical protein